MHKIEPHTRVYVRCQDCLTVSMVHYAELQQGDLPWKGYPLHARCGICDGFMEAMGAVVGEALVADQHLECLCDERCANATGPVCTCRCGGKHHGAQMAANVVRTTYDTEPRITPPGASGTALARALEYREALATAETRIKAHPSYDTYQAKLNGKWIDNFSAYLTVDGWWKSLREAKRARTHKSRMSKLATIA